MKIASVRIKNFRTYADETIHLADYTCFIGSNGAGKSTVLNALNVFFRQYTDSKTDLSKLSAEDFHHKNTKDPIEITVTFSDLSAKAQQDLADYVRQGKLTVTARADYDEGTERADVTQYGNRLGMSDFREWFDAEKERKSATELKAIFRGLREKWSGIADATSKSDMASALQAFESSHPEHCELIPSADQFYGISKGANRLAPHIQWVFVPAVKDITEEGEETKNSALSQLLLRTVKSKINFSDKVSLLRKTLSSEYQIMLDKEQGVLDTLSASVQKKLKVWATPNATAKFEWQHDPDKSLKIEEPLARVLLGEKGFESGIARFGHGMQRSYMLALLLEIVDLNEDNGPTLVLGIEEPELYQHPPQARHLAETLQELAHKSSQIIVCSHSPHFVPGDDFESIRLVRESGTPPTSSVRSLKYAELSQTLADAGEKLLKSTGMLAKLYPALRPELSEMFFCRNLVLVEGIEDVAYITTYVHLLGRSADFRRQGFHIVPVNGKSELVKPISIAKLLQIPTFVVCDADGNKQTEHEIRLHKSDNNKILKLLGYADLGPFPHETITKPNFRMWKTNLTDVVKSEIGENWRRHADRAAAQYGNAGGMDKNPLAISSLITFAWQAGDKSPSLEKLIHDILSMCELTDQAGAHAKPSSVNNLDIDISKMNDSLESTSIVGHIISNKSTEQPIA